MYDRMAFDAAEVAATIVPGVSITLTARQDAKVPVTGLGAALYGDTPIATVPLQAGQRVTLPLR
jgi:hypothetical protein